MKNLGSQRTSIVSRTNNSIDAPHLMVLCTVSGVLLSFKVKYQPVNVAVPGRKQTLFRSQLFEKMATQHYL